MAVIARYPCPQLEVEVELTDERARHIAARHEELYPTREHLMASALASPNVVLQSPSLREDLLFVRWFPDLYDGKYVVVVVSIQDSPQRAWIVTAMISGKRPRGVQQWPMP